MPAPPVAASPLPPDTTDARLVKAIGAASGTLFVVGSVVGSAIFLTTGVMADRMPSPALLLLAWTLGGVFAMTGGLTFAELGAMYPRSGGMYVFLREAYSPIVGFLYGWAALVVILSGGIAAVAVGFSNYLGYLVPPLATGRILAEWGTPLGTFTLTAGKIVGVASIAILGGINYVGVRTGNLTNAILTTAKIVGLVSLPLLALFFSSASPRFTPVVPPELVHPAVSFGVAMIAVLWAYDGWYFITFAAGEVRDAQRTLPRALIGGIAVIMAVYMSVNLAYLYTLPLDELRGVVRVAERAAERLVGPRGGVFLALTVVVSTFGCNAAAILAGSRLLFAMARDGLFFSAAAAVHPRYRTPHLAIIALSAWSAVLALSGSYEQLFTYVIFAAMFFNVACGAAVFRLRRTRPDQPRPYRTLGYPIVPAVFVLGSLIVVINTLMERPVESIAGLGLVALGVPAYLWRRRAGA